MINELLANIDLMFALAKNDLKARYSGSVLGILWSFVQPMVTVLVFWFVFQLGIKNPDVGGVEYILWFSAGYIPWIFFSDGVNMTSNVMTEYSYLVKKIKFKIWQLPIVKVMSATIIHIVLVLVVLLMYLLYGHMPEISWVSVIFYSIATEILMIGIGFFVSSLAVLYVDVAQLISIVMQIGFWVSPIIWNKDSMGPVTLTILKLNPMYYIIEGYRDALINGIGFWQQSVGITVYYWVFTLVMLVVGVATYRKLRPHFADLL